MLDRYSAKNKQNMALAGALAGLAAYLVVFYASRLPSLGNWRRIELLEKIALLPDELLLGAWFGSPAELPLFDRLGVLAVAAAVVGVGTATGWLLLVLLGVAARLDRLETFIFSTAVGLNAVSTFVLLAGLAGLLHQRWLFLVAGIVVVAAAGWLGWQGRARTVGQAERDAEGTGDAKGTVSFSLRENWDSPQADSVRVLGDRWLWAAVPFVVVIVLGAMLPPVDFDVLEYHLQVPKEWYAGGRIDFLPHNVYGNMPMGTEMLSLATMIASGDWWYGGLAGKTVIASFTLLTALGLVAAGRRFFSPSAGIVAALVYLSTPWTVLLATSGLVEGASACYLLLGVYAVLLWREEEGQAAGQAGKGRRAAWLLLAGYLAGAAVSTKYPAALFVAVPLAAWIALSAARMQRWAAWKPLGVFCLAVFVGCGAWFVKNAVLTGNPTYPLLYNVFGGRTWTAEKDAQWKKVHLPRDFSIGRLGDDLSKVAWRSEWLGPLLVPLAVLAAANRRRRRVSLALALLVGYVIAAWWLLSHRIDRFWLPTAPILALLAGWGACWRGDRPWRRALVGLLGFGLVAGWLVSTAGPGGYNRYFVSYARLREHPGQVDNRVDPWHQWFNERAAGGKVLLVGDAEPFDLEVPALYNTCFDDCIFEQLVRDRTPGAARAALASQGIGYVYVDWSEIARYRQPGNYGFTDFVQPEVFRRLVEQGVLEPLPEIEGHAGRAYRVVSP